MTKLQTGQETEKESKEEKIKYLETQLKIRSGDFETIQNIEHEKQKELFQSIVDSSSSAGIRLNDRITVDD